MVENTTKLRELQDERDRFLIKQFYLWWTAWCACWVKKDKLALKAQNIWYHARAELSCCYTTLYKMTTYKTKKLTQAETIKITNVMIIPISIGVYDQIQVNQQLMHPYKWFRWSCKNVWSTKYYGIQRSFDRIRINWIWRFSNPD